MSDSSHTRSRLASASSSVTAALRRAARTPLGRSAYATARRAHFEVALRIGRAREQVWQPPTPRPIARLDVILLSYKRPENIQPIAEGVLRCDFVRHLTISNNNPGIRLEDHVQLASSRLTIINQPEPCRPIKRFEIARTLDADHFLCLDDDVFLRTDQMEVLFRRLVASPRCAHGVIGQLIEADAGPGTTLRYRLQSEQDTTVDVLNRAYFFSAPVRDRFFTLLDALCKFPDRQPLRFGDDIVLSFAGERRPMIHDVGRVLFCPTGDDPAVARWLQPGFQEYRSAIYRDLREITGRAAPG